MTKRKLAELGPGSASYVLAHAVWKRRRGRGRRSSLHYLGMSNPAEALAHAAMIWEIVVNMRHMDLTLASLPRLTRTELSALSTEDLKARARGIVATCCTEQELVRRLREELGFRSPSVDWVMPTIPFHFGLRDVAYSVGGLVSGAGAVVSIMAFDPTGELIMM